MAGDRVNTYSVIDRERLGPLDERAGRDRCLSDREREGEPQLPLLVLKQITAPFVRDGAGQRRGNETEQLLKNSARNTKGEMWERNHVNGGQSKRMEYTLGSPRRCLT